MARGKNSKSSKRNNPVGTRRDEILTKATRGNKNDPKLKGKRLNADDYVDAQRPVYVEPE